MVVDTAFNHGATNLTEKFIYFIVAILIWLPLVADQFLLEQKLIVGNVEQISAPLGGRYKGFESVKVRIKEPNKNSVEYSFNPNAAKKLIVNHQVAIYESRLLFRVLKVEQEGVVLSNNYGGLNMAILVTVILGPAFFLIFISKIIYNRYYRSR